VRAAIDAAFPHLSPPPHGGEELWVKLVRQGEAENSAGESG